MALAISTRSKWRSYMIRLSLLILVLHCVGIYLFTRGFLLARTELSAHSNCSDHSNSSSSCSSFSPSPPPHSGKSCWTPPAVPRLVIIVLDALRFDFVAPSTFFQEKKPWMDKLRILQKLSAGNTMSARIFKAIADPPTTSLQRLKALTTGGLPTFIDIGNSFGAPAIVEDNLIHQMIQNGKRVLMMGDDTWLQLFPDHFQESYPYPSFNVKDLDTVDNGVIEHLLPSLYKEDWDVLIAHFLGVDHAGHIFGVDSTPMIQKLEQYNDILVNVVEVLRNLSGPGDLHENTLLLVMGDHGQTINGDHGGGAAEEVETALFAMSLKGTPTSASSILDSKSCKLDSDGEKICISTFQQLDFAVTVAALLGIPFPFGSIGLVNAELFALSAGTWNNLVGDMQNSVPGSDLVAWMQRYATTLCINSWQVKRYIDLYTATSVIGLPKEDFDHVVQLYHQAQANQSNSINDETLIQDHEMLLLSLQMQVNAYSDFLESVSQLARAAWTEFNIVLMGAGLVVLLVTIVIHLLYIGKISCLAQPHYATPFTYFTSAGKVLAPLLIVVRAASFLSSSYILEEGKVACFLLGTIELLNFLCSVSKGNFSREEFSLLILNIILRLRIEFGRSEQAVNAASGLRSVLGIDEDHHVWLAFRDIFPIFALAIMGVLLYKVVSGTSCRRYWVHVFVMGSIFSYMLIAAHWVTESSLIAVSSMAQDLGRNLAPRLLYAIGLGLLVLLILHRTISRNRDSNLIEDVAFAALSLVAIWSPTILILLGRQGPFTALVGIAGAWCITQSNKQASTESSTRIGIEDDGFQIIRIIQWSLYAVCLFFYTGHWCMFDGLRYGAAFVGFDNFHIIRQGLLLAIDTFGVSHIIPVLSLPLLLAFKGKYHVDGQSEGNFLSNLAQVFLCYGLITALTTTFSIICVTIQRRHLMVWGLFAPKYVFDVVGLLITDVLICLATLYYY